jgi:hypothetical protein
MALFCTLLVTLVYGIAARNSDFVSAVRFVLFPWPTAAFGGPPGRCGGMGYRRVYSRTRLTSPTATLHGNGITKSYVFTA